MKIELSGYKRDGTPYSTIVDTIEDWGYTPEQWASMADNLRDERVADWAAINELGMANWESLA